MPLELSSYNHTLEVTPRGQLVRFTFPLHPDRLIGGDWSFLHYGVAPLYFCLRWETGIPEFYPLEIDIVVSTMTDMVLASEWWGASSDWREGSSETEGGRVTSPYIKVTIKVNYEDTRPMAKVALDQPLTLAVPLHLAAAAGGPMHTLLGSVPIRVALGMLDCSLENDACFRFARGSVTRELGMKSSVLEQIFPLIKEGQQPNPNQTNSDDELHSELPFEPPHRSNIGDSPRTEHTQVDIVSHAYWTYRAVFCWVLSSHIAFAPLTSTFPGATPQDQRRNRTAWISRTRERSPFDYVTVSPKAVYRLAHSLGLAPLEELALDHLQSIHCPEGALEELLRDPSSENGYRIE